jgi:hypothetical protein
MKWRHRDFREHHGRDNAPQFVSAAKCSRLSVENMRQMATRQELPLERKQLRYQLLKPWLGREDSNLRMAESKIRPKWGTKSNVILGQF